MADVVAQRVQQQQQQQQSPRSQLAPPGGQTSFYLISLENTEHMYRIGNVSFSRRLSTAARFALGDASEAP